MGGYWSTIPYLARYCGPKGGRCQQHFTHSVYTHRLWHWIGLMRNSTVRCQPIPLVPCSESASASCGKKESGAKKRLRRNRHYQLPTFPILKEGDGMWDWTISFGWPTHSRSRQKNCLRACVESHLIADERCRYSPDCEKGTASAFYAHQSICIGKDH